MVYVYVALVRLKTAFLWLPLERRRSWLDVNVDCVCNYHVYKNSPLYGVPYRSNSFRIFKIWEVYFNPSHQLSISQRLPCLEILCACVISPCLLHYQPLYSVIVLLNNIRWMWRKSYNSPCPWREGMYWGWAEVELYSLRITLYFRHLMD